MWDKKTCTKKNLAQTVLAEICLWKNGKFTAGENLFSISMLSFYHSQTLASGGLHGRAYDGQPVPLSIKFIPVCVCRINSPGKTRAQSLNVLCKG
jgi:hypothetical protein